MNQLVTQRHNSNRRMEGLGEVYDFLSENFPDDWPKYTRALAFGFTGVLCHNLSLVPIEGWHTIRFLGELGSTFLDNAHLRTPELTDNSSYSGIEASLGFNLPREDQIVTDRVKAVLAPTESQSRGKVVDLLRNRRAIATLPSIAGIFTNILEVSDPILKEVKASVSLGWGFQADDLIDNVLVAVPKWQAAIDAITPQQAPNDAKPQAIDFLERFKDI